MVNVDPPCCFELKWAQQSSPESEYKHFAPVNSWLCKHNVNVNASNHIQHLSFFSLAKKPENPWGAGGCIALSNQESSFLKSPLSKNFIHSQQGRVQIIWRAQETLSGNSYCHKHGITASSEQNLLWI